MIGSGSLFIARCGLTTCSSYRSKASGLFGSVPGVHKHPGTRQLPMFHREQHLAHVIEFALAVSIRIKDTVVYYTSAAIRRHEIGLLFVYSLNRKTPGGAKT